MIDKIHRSNRERCNCIHMCLDSKYRIHNLVRRRKHFAWGSHRSLHMHMLQWRSTGAAPLVAELLLPSASSPFAASHRQTPCQHNDKYTLVYAMILPSCFIRFVENVDDNLRSTNKITALLSDTSLLPFLNFPPISHRLTHCKLTTRVPEQPAASAITAPQKNSCDCCHK